MSHQGTPEDDERLTRIERQLENAIREIGRVRTALGDRNTTLMFDLDTRYMPREEMATVYVPRKEHEAREHDQRTWRLQVPVVLFAGLGWLTNLVLVITSHH